MGKRLALIIGNSLYRDKTLSKLMTPDADIGTLTDILLDPEIGGFDDVKLLINSASHIVRREIFNFFSRKSRDDLLLFYFSGHGVVDDRGQLYLALKDTDTKALRGTAIPARYITEEMDNSRSKRQVLILDCCHSGAFGRGSKGVPGASVGTASAFEGSGYGRVVLTASDLTQYAWEGDQVIGEAETSLFTHFLVQGIQSGAADANGDGQITVDELYDYVYSRVLDSTSNQTPGKWSFKKQREIVIARSHSIAKPSVIPLETGQSSVSSRRIHIKKVTSAARKRPLSARKPTSTYSQTIPSRYANAVLQSVDGSKNIENAESLQPKSFYRLRLDIGPLSEESNVERPQPIPEHLLPHKDIWLDVVVSSSNFKITPSKGRLLLPKNGSPARTEQGNRYLSFIVQTPNKESIARARIGYYYKNVLIQSQLMTAHVGKEGGIKIEVDYTLSRTLSNFDRIPKQPRISILTNDNRNGKHQVVIRKPSRNGGGAADAITFELDSGDVDRIVSKIRKVLRMEGIIPTRKKRSKRQIIRDLRRLAPLGQTLFDLVIGRNLRIEEELREEENGAVIQVTRPTTASYSFPWGLMYDIPLYGNVRISNYEICSHIVNWNEDEPLYYLNDAQCPAGPHKKNTLCPFGFWAFRYPIEQLSSTERPILEIPVRDGAKMVIGNTLHRVNQEQLGKHINILGEVWKKKYEHVDFQKTTEVDKLIDLLGKDLPIVYFYCHGTRPTREDIEYFGAETEDTYLALGSGDAQRLKPMDFRNQIRQWSRQEKKVWDQVNPLIFINACHSLEISIKSLISYLEVFVGAANASGVIGTEVKVDQTLAMHFAELFYSQFFEGKSVHEALHKARLEFLKEGNMFGLVYTAYCWADLKLNENL